MRSYGLLRTIFGAGRLAARWHAAINNPRKFPISVLPGRATENVRETRWRHSRRHVTAEVLETRWK